MPAADHVRMDNTSNLPENGTPASRRPGADRFHRIVLIVSAVLVAWLWMQAVHELGHCLGAWATGASVERVILHPLAISRTDVTGGRSPLAVVWAGPVIGVLLPVAAWLLMEACRREWSWLARFFAGFCCLANGLYLGVGSFEGIGDAGDLLRLGSPIWSLWLFGCLTVVLGFSFWNGLGKHFGVGLPAAPVDARAAYALFAALALTAVLEFALSRQL
jgi:hypothetical protein